MGIEKIVKDWGFKFCNDFRIIFFVGRNSETIKPIL